MPYANDEEKRLIEQIIFLPLVKKVLEYNSSVFTSRVKLPRPYLQLNDQLFRLVSNDLRIAKHEIYKRKINVFEDFRDNTSIVYKAYVRGYEETHRYAFIFLKNKTEEYLTNYLQKLIETNDKQFVRSK